MDRIKSKIHPNIAAAEDYNDNYYNSMLNSSDLGGTSHNRFSMPFGQRNYTRPYTNYGDFQGMSDNIYQNDLNNDLTQLEYDMFGTEFSSDDTQTRIKRLNSAKQAKKSYKKYDSNKFNQHMSTAMEIGAMILMILAMVL